MRGDSQEVDLDPTKTISFMKDLTFVNKLLITGGEPFMMPHIITQLVMFMKSLKVHLGHFGIVTNGWHYSPEVLRAVTDLYDLCKDKGFCYVIMSNDNYHFTPNPAVHLEMLKILPGFSKEIYDRDPEIIAEGRALNIGNTTVEEMLGPPKMAEITDGYYIENKGLTLNAKGELVWGGDHSYENQSKHVICNVTDGVDILIERLLEMERKQTTSLVV